VRPLRSRCARLGSRAVSKSAAFVLLACEFSGCQVVLVFRFPLAIRVLICVPVASAGLRLSTLAARPAQNLLRFRFQWPPAGGAQSSLRCHPRALIPAHESSVQDLLRPILSSVSVFQARARRCCRQFSRQPDLFHIFLLRVASTLASRRAWICSPADSVKASKLAFLPLVECSDFSTVLSRPNVAQAK
jgi:hypothetical protein